MSNYEEYERREFFRKRLETLVEETDIPKYELVKKIGISQTTLSKALMYGIIPKTKTLILIADYFNTSLDYLLCKTDDPVFYGALNRKTFYERLQELKTRKGFTTNYALAQDSHLPRQFFYDWEKNHHLPSVDVLEYLSEYFEVSLDYLLGRSD